MSMSREYDELTEMATLICLIHCGNPRRRRLRKAVKLAVEHYCRKYLDSLGRHSAAYDGELLSDEAWHIFELLEIAKQSK